MASQTQGIQQLLGAEKRAAEKVKILKRYKIQTKCQNSGKSCPIVQVSEARKRKNRRLKQAKEEVRPQKIFYWFRFEGETKEDFFIGSDSSEM